MPEEQKIASAETSDADIQALLSGEAVAGPRSFRGRRLAKFSRGLRDLRNKVVADDDTALFHDLTLLHILTLAHGETDAERFEKRRILIDAAADVPGFRASVSLLMDDLEDADLIEARRLVNDILGIIEKAEVSLAEKKWAGEEPAELSPTTEPSPSSPSPGNSDGSPTSSAGS